MTNQQRKALHKYCELLALELNNAGLDMKAVLKPEVDIPWNKMSVKDHLWKPIESIMINKESTEEMTNKEVSEVYEVLNRHLAQKLGVSVPFPEFRGEG